MYKISTFTSPSWEHRESGNQDTIAVNREKGLMILCDGMGGHLNGAGASQMAVAKIQESTATIPDNASPGVVLQGLVTAIQTAHKSIYENLYGSGTTATVAQIVETVIAGKNKKVLVFANVGDSRAYVLRNGKLQTLTLDQSLLRGYVEGDEKSVAHVKEIAKGMKIQTPKIGAADYDRICRELDTEEDPTKLSKEAKFFFHVRQYVSSGVGLSKQITIDSGMFILEDGDKVILTSDGIHDTFTQKQIIASLTREDPRLTPAEKLGYDVWNFLYKENLQMGQFLPRDEHIWPDNQHFRGKVDDISTIVAEVKNHK